MSSNQGMSRRPGKYSIRFESYRLLTQYSTNKPQVPTHKVPLAELRRLDLSSI